jgi:RNA polymerase sigma-70 factor (ECF subfamily)
LVSPADLESEVARLHDEYSTELTAYAVSIIKCQEAARDAVQEAFLRYLVERTCGRLVGYPRAWLYRVVRNYLLDRIDAAAMKHEVGQEQAVDLDDEGHSPEEMLRCAQMARQLTSLLSAREMECLGLRADGLSYEEISDVLRIRPGTVSALLTRVNKKFREAARNNQDRHTATSDALFLLMKGGPYSFSP